jgi:hypothetical protein
MHQRLTRQGWSSFFFQPLSDGFATDAVHHLQLDERFGEHMQCPSTTTGGRFTAGQLHEPRFAFSVQLHCAWLGLLSVLKRRCKSLEHEPLAQALDSGQAHIQVLDNFLIQQTRVCFQ